MSLRKHALAFSVALGALLGSPAFAQQPASGTPVTTTVPQAPVKHPKLDYFLNQLGLTDQQKSQIAGIEQPAELQIKAIRHDKTLTKDEKQAQIKPIEKSEHKQILAVLTKSQRKQLKELRAQWKQQNEPPAAPAAPATPGG